MRVLGSLLFLTFVLNTLSSWAAPETKTTVETTPFTGEYDPSLTAVSPELRDFVPTFYLNLSLGFSGGNYLERDKYDQGPFLVLRYMPIEEKLRHSPIGVAPYVWDYHLEINKENIVGLALGRRWYCCPGDTFMPYARASANMFLSGRDELGGFAEIRRWRLRAAVGIGESFVSEFGVGLAVTGPDLYAQFGYNFIF